MTGQRSGGSNGGQAGGVVFCVGLDCVTLSNGLSLLISIGTSCCLALT